MKHSTYLKEVIQKDPSLEQELKFESWIQELSLNIMRLRKEKGYSQKKFADMLETSQSAVARIEAGQDMRCSTIWKISNVFEVKLEIFGADKDMENEKAESFYVEAVNGAESDALVTMAQLDDEPIVLNSFFESNAIEFNKYKVYATTKSCC